MLLLYFLLPLFSSCRCDPCTPSPCGDHTWCTYSYYGHGDSPVISCQCLIGYHVPAGGDPFDGCIKQSVDRQRGTRRIRGGIASPPSLPSKTHVHTTQSTIYPLSTLPSVVREYSGQDNTVSRGLDTSRFKAERSL